MDKRQYSEILKNTISNYPEYLVKDLIKLLEEKGLVNSSKKPEIQLSLLDEGTKNLYKLSINEKINAIFEINNNEAEKAIELFEFEREYTYSALFKIEGYEDTNSEISIKPYNANEMENDSKLIYKQKGDKLYIKNVIYLHSDEGEKIKYPIIVVIKDGFLEVRLNKVSVAYRNCENFYSKQIKETLDMLIEQYNFELLPLNFKQTVKIIESEQLDSSISIQGTEEDLEINSEFRVISKDMRLKSGAKAKLDSDSNPKYTIPILGDLQELIEENKDLFNSNTETMQILEKLNFFIEKINKTSDIPSIGIILEANNNKYQVYITHNYKAEAYSLLTYRYPLNSNEERMDYVRDYFIENYRQE